MSGFRVPEALRHQPDVRLPACLQEDDGDDDEFPLPEALREDDDREISLPPALVEDDDQEDDADDEDDRPEQRDPGRYYCRECGRRVTRSTSGKEYGHRRRPRCPRRETNVDPGGGPKSRHQRRGV